MMKYLTITVSLLAVVAFASEEIEKDEGVLVLTTKNFEQTISGNEYVLVEFYAPWCGHCKALKPEYEKAAKQLESEGSSILLGKVDATVESSLAESHEVRGYPTLKFFKNGTPVEYTGGRIAEEIVAWLKKKTGPPAQKLETVDEAKALQESAEVVVVGFFSDQESEDAKKFLKAAESFDDIPFGISSNEDVKKNYEITKDSIVVLQKFDDGRADYSGAMEAEEIAAFVKGNSLPMLVEFSHTTAQKIFGGDMKSHLLLFLSKADAKYATYSEAATKVAKEFKGQLLFVLINTDEEEHVRILEFFGMDKDNTPAMRIIQLKEEMDKYKPATDDVTEDSIRTFVSDFLAGKLKQHLLSQALPEDWNKNPVWVLVSTNFDSVALDNTKDVLVEFYAPWCGHCKSLAPIYDELGEKFQDKDDIVIAKMDATANELEHTKIQSFPTIKMWKKDNTVIVSSLLLSINVFGSTLPSPRAIYSPLCLVAVEWSLNIRGEKYEVEKEDEEENEEDVPSKDEL
ncbi:unnamed protein product [Cyprideis torosa]|uniref:Protein disulfide-isomerase n=1 Tax=Cyprideis torosa TaxID=163714 RepID=A0A7R8WCS3_9CRUS|nr:unnamed protein product [Cyprideis torosa]CAG0888689.1 unnamed protein product [Cyprideis torosa]